MDDQTHQTRGSPQKGIILAVFLLALFSAVFGILKIRQGLVLPTSTVTDEQLQAAFSQQIASADIVSALEEQGKDTDSDGLSDYDEAQRYKTSPYLSDTDGDGFDDKKEIETGNNPNCPKGQECAGATFSQGVSAATTPPLALTPSESGGIPPFSPDLLKQALRQQGAKEEDIARLDESMLRQLYDDTLQELQSKTSASVPTPSAPIAPLEFLTTASPDQLRAFLKANGVAENIINSVDDATLRSLVMESLKETQKQ